MPRLALAITGARGTPSWPKDRSLGPRVRPGPLLSQQSLPGQSQQLEPKAGLDQRLHNPACELRLGWSVMKFLPSLREVKERRMQQVFPVLLTSQEL